MTQYSGKLIRKTPLTPTQQSASGVWKLNEQAAAIRNNAWPVAGVPDPISRSVRFRASANPYFTRAFGTSTSDQKMTMSFWFKRGVLGAQYEVLNTNRAYSTRIEWSTGNALNIWVGSPGTSQGSYQWTTTALYRDPSAWYHVVVAIDTTNATANNRVQLWVNGVQVTSWSTQQTITQNINIGFSGNSDVRIGYNATDGNLDGYLTEFNYVDGQALTASSFGTTDAFTGAWVPMAYTGTYGANGFYLNFKDNTSTTTIGYDYSGNANNWTANNISLTAGTTYDSMLDVPTPWVGYSTTTDTSAVTRGNYSDLNPLFRNSSMISDGNLYFNKSTIGWATGQATMSLPASKTYFEATATLVGGANSGVFIGVATSSATQDTYQVANQWSFGGTGGALKLYNQTTLVTPSGSSAAGDIFQVAYDGTTGYLWFGKNNTWYDSAGGTTGNPSTGANPTMTLTAGTEIFPCAICYANGLKFTFGQQPFTYTPPTGYKALCATNLPDPTIKLGAQYMAASTYTGNGTTQSIVNSGNNTTATTFQPDFVWIKNRTAAYTNLLFDSTRGVGNYLQSNTTDLESAGGSTFLSAFNSNGFSVGSYVGLNNSGNAIIGWQWKANGSAVSNTDGSIASQVNAGTTQGFSVVTWTGNGTITGQTVGHGLGVTPAFIITKSRSDANNWNVWHKSLSSSTTSYLSLNLTDAVATSARVWGSTAPTSSTFGVGWETGSVWTNKASSTFTAYCWAEVAGFSKFGSYTGNGSTDGPFVYCGFRPRFVIIKCTSTISHWTIEDSSTNPYNQTLNSLYADTSAAENNAIMNLDFLSNGFKCRNVLANESNVNGATYIFAAFAENPFKYSNAR